VSLSTLESHYKAGNYVAAQKEFRRLLAETTAGNPGDESRLYYLGSMTHLFLNDLFTAARLNELARERAKTAGEWETYGLGCYYSGVIYGEIGDTHMAGAGYMAFLTDLSKYPSLAEFEGYAYYGLGLLAVQRSDLTTATTLYQQAEPLIRSTNRLEPLLQVLHSLVWSLFEQGRNEQADDFLTRSFEVVEALQTPQARLAHKVNEAFGAMMRGSIKQALSLCEEVITPAAGAPDSMVGWAVWIVAECGAQTTTTPESSMMVGLALDLATKTRNPRLMNYAGRTRAKLLRMQSA
jgi:tetratricopeptide (TPR) repeat protein